MSFFTSQSIPFSGTASETITVDTSQDADFFVLSIDTSSSLTGNKEVAVIGTLFPGSGFWFYNTGNFNAGGGNNLVIAGIAVSEDLSVNPGLFLLRYNGSAWELIAIPNFLSPAIIGTSNIVDNSVTNTKLAQMPALTIKANATNSSSDAQDIAADSANTVFKRNGSNQLVFGAVATDDISAASVTNAKMANMAALSIKGNSSATPGVPSDLSPATVKDMLGLPNTVSISRVITESEILAINTTPVELVPAQGFGIYIEPIYACIRRVGGTAYSGDTNLVITTGSGASWISLDCLSNTSLSLLQMSITGSGGSATTNVPLLLMTEMSDPTGGTGNYKIYVVYRTFSS